MSINYREQFAAQIDHPGSSHTCMLFYMVEDDSEFTKHIEKIVYTKGHPIFLDELEYIELDHAIPRFRRKVNAAV